MWNALHITNGQIVADLLQEAGAHGTVLSWTESLYEGPLGSDDLLNKWLPKRATYFEQVHGVSAETFLAISEQQERMLTEEFEQLVLWFDEDLYDQTMLARIFDLIIKKRFEHLPTIHLVTLQTGTQSKIEQVDLSLQNRDQWTILNNEHLRIGQHLWQAYVSDDPTALEHYIHSNRSKLKPFSFEAFFFHLTRFPSTYNGLNTIEQRMLELLDGQDQSMAAWFQQTVQAFPLYGLTDIVFRTLVEDGAHAASPLWKQAGDRVQITDFGQAVLLDRETSSAAHFKSRWLGGVHLQGEKVKWRWDPKRQKLSAQYKI